MALQIIFGLLLVSTAVWATTDFCKYNCDDLKNIGCGTKSALSKRCRDLKGELYDFTPSDIDYWLHLDNDRRNQIANGSLSKSGYKPAANMVVTQWNADFATLAGFNTQTCNYKHDHCHNIPKYSLAGQNIAMYSTSNGYAPVTKVIKIVHDLWFNEYKLDAAKYVAAYPREEPSEEIGHFTQIVKYNSPFFGCSAVKYQEGGWFNWYVACNYALTNMITLPVYVTGAAGSKCKTGLDTKYKALCTINEVLPYP